MLRIAKVTGRREIYRRLLMVSGWSVVGAAAKVRCRLANSFQKIEDFGG